jgi:hypothetical protein
MSFVQYKMLKEDDAVLEINFKDLCCRNSNIHVIGTDVMELTRNMFNYLTQLDGVTMHFHHEVQN